MADRATIQSAIIGDVLPNIGRRHAGMRTDATEKALLRRLGSPRQRAARLMASNVQRVPQSVVKRVRNGGVHTRTELRRQLEYITRDEAVKSTWLNFNGVERGLYKNSVETTVPLWESGWAGNPKRGHTDHIILSFPKDVDVEKAEQIAREWGRAVFASGDFGDQWRYMAALHANTDHVHAHFVVDKRGIEHGNFMSISMKSELNYDVMRELHAKIANEHGVALNASTRLSRGIAEYPPRETEYRAAHDNLGVDGTAAPNVAAPNMSMIERIKRDAVLRSFASQYRSLSAIAQLTADPEGQGGFMRKLSKMFSAASDILNEGRSLMNTPNDYEPNIDPTESFAHDVERIFTSAQQAWSDIQNMEPSAERVQLEARFAEQTRIMQAAAVSDPFWEKHSRALTPDEDPYCLALVRDIHSARDHLNDDPAARRALDISMDEIRQRLEAAFTASEDKLAALGTNAEEMAERFVLSSRTVGQVERWRASDAVAEEHLRASDPNDVVSQTPYHAIERELAQQAANIIGDYEVPRDLQEVIARDQLLFGEKYQRLSDVPAIEAIVERMTQELSIEELTAVRAGDYSVLREEIKDPAIRAAVGSELRNEADISSVNERHSEPVDQFQQLARQTAGARAAQQEHSAALDLSDDIDL